MLPNNDLSFQLWSSRASSSLAEQFAVLKAAGYTDVQPSHEQWADPEGLRDRLTEFGLSCKTGHFPIDMLDAEHDRVVSACRLLGIGLVVAPYLIPEKRPADREGWRDFGAYLLSLSERYAKAGLRFAWHNHEFEFVPLADGSYPIEHLLGDRLDFEIDIAWVARADTDPAPWLERYSGRIPAVHVKDMAPLGEKLDEDGWADVGSGILPWRTLLPLAVASGAELIVAEHDNPSDYKRFAAASAKAILDIAGASPTK